ncbi:MAG TPA: response regulator [Planctomycetes bacterium]|nr:response regulator [Planctomycetota bacterium]
MRVLIAEDNEIYAHLISVACQELDCDVVIVDDGEVALERALADEWDLVVLDNRMPGMTGLEVARRIADKRRVIMITSDPIQEEAFAAGVDGFLRKPFDPESLKSLIAGT